MELLLTLPMLFIALFVVVEFGLVMANLKQVALISREGAKFAAETTGLSTATSAVTAAMLRAVVDRRMEAAGFGANASRGVTLRHTVSGDGVATNGTCSDPMSPFMPSGAVRVTVCVDLTKLTPNLLRPFGFNVAGMVAEQSATFDYEK